MKNQPFIIGLVILITLHAQTCPGQLVTTSGKCVDTCPPGEYLNIFQDACVLDCGSNYIDLLGTTCLEECPALLNQIDDNGRCVCVKGTKLSLDGLSCIQKCPQGSVSNGLVPKQCVCKSSDFILDWFSETCLKISHCLRMNFFVSSNGKQCVQSCSANFEIISLDGSTCVTDCGSNAISLDLQKCVLRCGQNEIKNSNGFCVCNPTSTLNLQKTGCIPVSQCPTGSSVNPTDSSSCVCSAGNILSIDGLNCISISACFLIGIPDSQLKRCLNSCGEVGEFLSPSGQQCLTKCSPPSNFVNVLQNACIEDCQSDNAFYSPDRTACLAACLGPLSIDGITCLEEGQNCPTGQLLDLSGQKCVNSCPSPQLKNSDGTKCVAFCALGEVLSVAGDSCVTDCAPGFLNFNGDRCVVSCASISGILNASGNQCVAVCPQNQFINVAGNKCVVNCGANKFIRLYDNRCVSVCGANQVVVGKKCTCNNLLSLNSQACLLTCPAPQIPVSNQCKACTVPCATCITSVINCLSCVSPLYLLGTACVVNCPDGFFKSQTPIKKCNACIADCLTCTSALTCTTCKDARVFVGGQCANCNIDSCSKCATKTTCLTCVSPKSLALGNTKCVFACGITDCLECSSLTTCSSCSIGKVPISPGNLTCGIVCTSITNCDTCASSIGCSKCKDGFLRVNSLLCSPCPPNCKLCTTTTQCSTCNIGYTLNTNTKLCALTVPPPSLCGIPNCAQCIVPAGGSVCQICVPSASTPSLNLIPDAAAGFKACVPNQCGILRCRSCVANSNQCTTCEPPFKVNGPGLNVCS